MRIAVLLKQVPDIVEELEVAPDGQGLASDDLTYRLNEFDDYALEEALQLKAAGEAEVIALALDGSEAEALLYTALAKGADRAIKITGAPEDARDPRAAALMLAAALRPLAADLILTGVQAPDDLEGQTSPLVGAALGLPHVNVVTGIELSGSSVTVTQEFSGGLVATLRGDLPVVLGVQSSRQPPRYAAITRVRAAMAGGKLETVAVDVPAHAPRVELRRLYKPEATSHAEMIEGGAEEAAATLAGLLKGRGFGGQ